jgi:hypothetical protein
MDEIVKPIRARKARTGDVLVTATGDLVIIQVGDLGEVVRLHHSRTSYTEAPADSLVRIRRRSRVVDHDPTAVVYTTSTARRTA